MSVTFLVETDNGAFIRKTAEELKPEDRLVFDGPDAFKAELEAQAALDAEIEAAGGLESWRASFR